MELVVEPGRCSVCRLEPGHPWPSPTAPGLFAATRTPDELSVVCPEGTEPEGARVEPGWRVLRIVGPLDFDLVGVVASVAAPLAGADVPLFVLSTFDTDLVLVKDEDLDLAVDALGGAGHRIVSGSA